LRKKIRKREKREVEGYIEAAGKRDLKRKR
jgi:hypothetical protein